MTAHFSTGSDELWSQFLDRYSSLDIDDSHNMTVEETIAAVLSDVTAAAANGHLRMGAAEMLALILTEESGETSSHLTTSYLDLLSGIISAPVEITLDDLTISPSFIVEGAPAGTVVGTLQGMESGSSVSLTDTAGTRFALDGTVIEAGATATDYEAAPTHNITVRETLAEAVNSPHDTVIAVPVWTPLDLFGSGEDGAWYDPSDLSTLWQDTAGTTPVTTDGQAVARIDDKSGNGYHSIQATAANQPLYKTSGGLRWLLYDGVNGRSVLVRSQDI